MPNSYPAVEAGETSEGYGDMTRCFFSGGGLQNWESDDNAWSFTNHNGDHVFGIKCGRSQHHRAPHDGSCGENNHQDAAPPSHSISQPSLVNQFQPDQPVVSSQPQGQTTLQQKAFYSLKAVIVGHIIEFQQAASGLGTTWSQIMRKIGITTSSMLVISLFTLLLMVPGCAGAIASSCSRPNYIMHENGFCCGVVSCKINFTVSMCTVRYRNDTCRPCEEGSFLLDETTSLTATKCITPKCDKDKTRPSLVKSTTIDPHACPQWCQCDLSRNFCGTDPCNCDENTCRPGRTLQQNCGCSPNTPSPPKPTPPKANPETEGNFSTTQPSINVSTESSALPVDTLTPGVTPFLPGTPEVSDSQSNVGTIDIVGIVLGVLAFCIIVVIVVLCLRRRQEKSSTKGVPSSPDGPLSNGTTGEHTVTGNVVEGDSESPLLDSNAGESAGVPSSPDGPLSNGTTGEHTVTGNVVEGDSESPLLDSNAGESAGVPSSPDGPLSNGTTGEHTVTGNVVEGDSESPLLDSNAGESAGVPSSPDGPLSNGTTGEHTVTGNVVEGDSESPLLDSNAGESAAGGNDREQDSESSFLETAV